MSTDALSWTTVGTASASLPGAQGFDIDDNGFDQTSRLYYVLIVDISNSIAPNVPATCNTGAVVDNSGSDIDAVAVLSSIVPAIEMTKTATPTTNVEAGDIIQYTFSVENTGTDTLNAITVTDPKVGLSAINCLVTTLAPDATTTCSATYTVTQADVDAGVPIHNEATASGQPASGGDRVEDDDDADVTVQQLAGIEIDKIADNTTALVLGQTIPYRFVVKNTGTVSLTNVTVTDPLPGLSAITPSTVAVLAAGQSTTFNASYVITQADVDAGTVSNTATATGGPPVTCPTCQPPTDTDTEIVPGAPTPKLSLEKSSNVVVGAPLTVGQQITYSFKVTNTGNVTVNNVTVTDPLPGLSAVSPVSVPLLNPGANTTFTATYSVTQADINAGKILNTATTTGEPPDTCLLCPPVEPGTDTHEIIVPQTPGVSIEKSSTPVGNAKLGDTLTYLFDVTNTGNVTLTDVTIDDPLVGLTWVTGPNVGTLQPGQSTQASATYVVTQADFDLGNIHNVASVTGVPPANCICTPPTDEDEHDVPVAGTPGIKLVKGSNVPLGSTVGVGDTVSYTFEVTNTGDVPLTNVTVTDPHTGLSWVVGPNIGTIAVGDSKTAVANYVVTQADVDAGSIVNNASATGQCGQGCTPPTDEDDEEVPTDPAAPALDIEKTSDPTGGVELGDAIAYTFTVTNTGNVTLSNVSVSDPLPGLSAITPASIATLAPGASTTFTATYTVVASDVARGFVHNTATATGTPPQGCAQCPPVTDTDDNDVPTKGNAGILLDKEAQVSQAVTLGQTITYTFEVFNIGDVNLKNVVVTDPLSGLSAISCPQTTLSVGQSMTCSATYQVKQADINRGRIDNSATVSGDPADGGAAVTDTDDESVPTARQIPGIDIEKSASTAGPVKLGDVITYTFAVENTGNVTLTDVTITDVLAGLNWAVGPNLGALNP
ncbi:MAG: DUF7507 domain-containing protein, partial [Thermomicrobiales bacterium]